MTAAFAAALTLSAAPAAAQAPDCSAAYKAEYAAEWQMSAADWAQACAKGLNASDVLRQAQRGSMARCVAKFQPYEQSGKIPTGQVGAFCAQGAAGRAQLAAAAGVPAEAAPPPPRPPGPRIPDRKPGSAGMGPLSAALSTAREVWQPDACFSGLTYHFGSRHYPYCDEFQRDSFNYYFSSKASERDIYRVSYHDELKQCPNVASLKGPNHQNAPRPTGLDACLSEVSVDVGQAVEIAERNGWKAAVPIRAVLASFPKAFFARTCGRGTAAMGGKVWRDYPVTCGDGDWDAARLRRATGSPVWVLSSHTQTAIVDARTGRFRFLGAGEFDMDLPFDPGAGVIHLKPR